MRIKITDDEQAKILGLMNAYRGLHDGIGEIEVGIKNMELALKEAYKCKQELDSKILAVRTDEDVVIKGLIQKYGYGKLNLDDMEWIANINNLNITHDTEHVEESSNEGE